MGVDYIPERDHRAAVWMKNFSRELVADSDAYRTTADDAAQVDAAVLAFRTANAQCWPSAVRSKTLVMAKNDARKAAEQLIRSIAQRIRADPSISPALKVNIGLKPMDKRRRHVGPPANVPVLAMTAQLSGRVELKVLDSQTNRKARPAGAIGYELYERIVPINTADGSAQTWQFVGTYTTTPISFLPSAQQPGDQVWLMARWVTRRGETGAFGNAKGVGMGSIAMRAGSIQQPAGRRAA